MDEKTLASIGSVVVRIGLSIPSLGLLLAGAALSGVFFTRPHSGGLLTWAIVLLAGGFGLLLAWLGLFGILKAWRANLDKL
jgi:amino acid transporter